MTPSQRKGGWGTGETSNPVSVTRRARVRMKGGKRWSSTSLEDFCFETHRRVEEFWEVLEYTESLVDVARGCGAVVEE